jgi:endo-1,4-beta-xylanase
MTNRISIISMTAIFLAANLGAQPALRDVFKNDFLIGVALNASQFTSSDKENCEVALIKRHFNAITPENVLKWGEVHPQPMRYNFGPADRYVAFGIENKMFIVGHNLIWHNQTPAWVFENDAGAPVDRDTLLQRMRDHILTVVGRYKGKIQGWDVVNEALDEDGSLRATPWLKIIGEDYLVKAYQFAHEADPKAELYYNEYSMENAPKRAGAIALIKKLQAAGIPLAAVGVQGHYNMKWPTKRELGQTIDDFSVLGVKVMITELDVDVLPSASHSQSSEVTMNFKGNSALNPYAAGLPDSMQQALARRYAVLFAEFVKHRNQITRVTFWGVTDGDSWLNNWPIRGRTSYPLLFDRDCQPKAAFGSVIGLGK